MYTPKHFAVDGEMVRKIIEENGFATILSFPEGEPPFINHLPLMFGDSPEILLGHMSRKNPQWMHFKKNPRCTALIHGPHAYITPRWYKSGRDVPTWNYAAVHLHGRVELIEDFAGQKDVLEKLSEFYERASATPWEFELPEDLASGETLTAAIVSFKFMIEKTEAKFKLSQNRPAQDRAGVIEGLLERTDDESARVRAIMIELEKNR